MEKWICDMKKLVRKKRVVNEIYKRVCDEYGCYVSPYTKNTMGKWNKHIVPRNWVDMKKKDKMIKIGDMCKAKLFTGQRVNEKVVRNLICRYLDKLINVNYPICGERDKVHFVRVICGSSGCGKTYGVRKMLEDGDWNAKWLDPDELNLKQYIDRYFGSAMRTVNMISMFEKHMSNDFETKKKEDDEERCDMYVIDDVDIIHNKASIDVILSNVLTTKQRHMMDRIFHSQTIMTPLIMISTMPTNNAIRDMIRRLQGLDAYVMWPRPTVGELQRYLIKTQKVGILKAIVLAKRANGDYRTLQFDHDGCDMTLDAIRTMSRMCNQYKVEDRDMDYKLASDVMSAYTILYDDMRYLSDMSKVISDMDIMMTGDMEEQWEYVSIIPNTYVNHRKDMKNLWNEDKYLEALYGRRCMEAKFNYHKSRKRKVSDMSGLGYRNLI